MARSPGRRPRRMIGGEQALEFLRLLWAIDHQLQRASKRLARELGVTGPQRLAVRVIATTPGMAPQDVAAALHLHKSTVTGILQRLEEQGLIRRSADPSDRRRARLHLTPEGEQISQARGPTIERAVQSALEPLSGDALEAARLVLSGVAAQLEAATARRRPARRRRRAARRPLEA